MAVLGVTGGVGAGKSRILTILKEEYGAAIIQADEVARQLEEPGRPGLAALVECFGNGILNSEGELDRARFAGLIFADHQALLRTNEILHPLVWDQIRSRISEKKDRLTAVEAALFDEKSREICDCLLFVDTDEETRIRRLIENRGYSRGQCLAVMRNQPDRESFLKLTDYVIDNKGTEEDVKRQLSEVMKEISTNETC